MISGSNFKLKETVDSMHGSPNSGKERGGGSKSQPFNFRVGGGLNEC